MNSMHRAVSLVVAIGIAASCTHVPRSPNGSYTIASVRKQYLDDHPDGKFNEQIIRGELVKGMNVIEVLASWGLPERRQWAGNSSEESWVYTARDEHSQDVITYELVFKARVLSRWIVGRGTAASGGVFSTGSSTYSRGEDEILRFPRPRSLRDGTPKK